MVHNCEKGINQILDVNVDVGCIKRVFLSLDQGSYLYEILWVDLITS